MENDLKTQRFIEKARAIHGDKYDYSKTMYVNSTTPVLITCPKHGDFYQMPGEHLKGSGCKQCGLESRAQKRRKGNDEFIAQARVVHGDKYDYSKCDYQNAHTKVCIICPEHGEFWMEPNHHVTKHQGCPKCRGQRISQSKVKSTEQFITDAKAKHPDENYDYSEVNYTGNKNPVIITCPKGHRFFVRPNDFLSGHGCPECAKHFGVAEGSVLKVLTEAFGNVVQQYKPKWLQSRTSYQSIDIFLPDYNVGVEYQGAQHFGAEVRFHGEEGYKILSERDVRKYNKCLEHGVKLFYISFEKNVPENYIDVVYRNTNDLIAAIRTYISQTQPIRLTEGDIERIVLKATKTIINNYL
jgi:hypothetical protein